MFAFLLIVQTLIAISLIGVILMQRSEGGGLGVGGSSSGFMTARGAADFLTRSTAVLGGLFIVLSIVMAAIAGATRAAAEDRYVAGQQGGRRLEQTRPPADAGAELRHEPAAEPAGARGSARAVTRQLTKIFSLRRLAPVGAEAP